MSNTFLFLQFSFIKLVCAWFCFPFIPEIIDLICRQWFQNKVVKYRNSESYCTAMRLCLLTLRRAKENQLWMSIKYNQCSPNLIPWSWLNVPLQKLYAITQHSFQNKRYLFLKWINLRISIGEDYLLLCLLLFQLPVACLILQGNHSSVRGKQRNVRLCKTKCWGWCKG